VRTAPVIAVLSGAGATAQFAESRKRMAMSKRVQVLLVGLVCFLMGCLVTQQLPFLHAQPADESKKPLWSHGHMLKVRKAEELDWKDAKKIGVEVFKDTNNGNLIYITEQGYISVVPGK
jgi:hypothetical protein